MTGRERRGRALAVFMRCPEPGKVKQRLAMVLGEKEAMRIYTMLVRRTLGVVNEFRINRSDTDVFLFYEPPEAEAIMRNQYPGPWMFIAQRGGDLGERMEGAFLDLFEMGYRHVVLVGSDIVDICSADLEKAFTHLSKGVIPIGPAKDGGFYLIGLSTPLSAVFRIGDWSRDDVLQRVLMALGDCKAALLETRRDVDVPEDSYLLSSGMFRDSVSTIIPFVGESANDALSLASRVKTLMWPGDEIIMVEGSRELEVGSSEERLESGVRLIRSRLGRGLQLNAGAAASSGDILWFLHCDCDPPGSFGYWLRKLDRKSYFSLGCFRLGFRGEAGLLRLVSMWANARTALLKVPYGDQGIFCRREMFSKIGGLRRRLIMEDVDMVRSLKKQGPVLFLKERLLTSAGRYLRCGIVRTALRNQLTMCMYLAGISEERIYRHYYGGD